MPLFMAKRQIAAGSNQVSSINASPAILTAPQVTYATTYNFSAMPTPSETMEADKNEGLDGSGTSGSEKAIIISCIVGAGLVVACLVVYMTLKRRRQAEQARRRAIDAGMYSPGEHAQDPAYRYHSSASDHDGQYMESVLSSPVLDNRYTDVASPNMTNQPYQQYQPNLPDYPQSKRLNDVKVYQPTSSRTPHEQIVQDNMTSTFPPDYKDKNGGPPFAPFARQDQPYNRYTIDSVAAASMSSYALHKHKPHYTTYADLLLKSNPYSESVHTRGRANSIASSRFNHNVKERQSSNAPTIPTRRNSFATPADLAMALPPMMEATFTPAAMALVASTPAAPQLKSTKSLNSVFLFPQPLKPIKKDSRPTLKREQSVAELSGVSSPTVGMSSPTTTTTVSMLSPIMTNPTLVRNQNINDAYRDSTLWQSQEQEQTNHMQNRISLRPSQEALGRGGLASTLEQVDWQSIDWNAKIGSARVQRPRSSVYSALGAKEENDWEAHRMKVIAALQSRHWADGRVVSTKEGRISPAQMPKHLPFARSTFGQIQLSVEGTAKEKRVDGMVASITEVSADEDRF